MAKDDFYARLLGLTAKPSLTPLSGLLGTRPTPVPTSMNADVLSGLYGPSPTPPTRTGICFGNFRFSEPAPLGTAWLPMGAGLYAILVLDMARSPRPYRVLYFGKAESLAARVVPSHEKHAEWRREAGAARRLYVAFHSMPRASDSARAAAEESLIKQYAPVCNKTFNSFAQLVGRTGQR